MTRPVSRTGNISDVLVKMFLTGSRSNAVVFFISLGLWHLSGQVPKPGRQSATVHVRAVGVFGKSLNSFAVLEFTDSDGNNMAGGFGSNFVAKVPYGTYKVSAFKSGFREFEAVVEVFARDVVLTVCFETEAMEDPAGRILTGFRGRIVGYRGPKVRDGSCKAVGLYLRLQYESALSPHDFTFDFGLVAPGTYIFTCIADSRSLVLRQIRLDGGAPPVMIDFLNDLEANRNPKQKQFQSLLTLMPMDFSSLCLPLGISWGYQWGYVGGSLNPSPR